MTFTPTLHQASRAFSASANWPANKWKSSNGNICESKPLEDSIAMRAVSWLAEMGFNLAIGNGELFGLCGTPDCPPDIEIKWTKTNKLIVTECHLDRDLRYLLAGGWPTIHYLGWCQGSEITEVYAPNQKGARYILAADLRSIPSDWISPNAPSCIAQ